MAAWKRTQKHIKEAESGVKTKKMTDFEVRCYVRGWNAALRTATDVMKDFLILREEDFPSWGGNGTTGRTTRRADG